MTDFIDEMPLTEGDKLKLRSLGVRSPGEMLALLDAAKEASRNFLGPAILDKVRNALGERLSNDERDLLGGPVSSFYLGARTMPSPKPVPPPYDLAERDHLFSRIQALKSRAGTSANSAVMNEIEALESQLNHMLER